MGAPRGAVRLVELQAIDGIVSDEVAVIPGQGDGAGIERSGGIGGRIDVGQEGGARRGAVGGPGLDAMDPVVGVEHDLGADHRQRGHAGVKAARVDVLDDVGSGRRPVGDPEFGSVRRVRVGEVKSVVEHDGAGEVDVPAVVEGVDRRGCEQGGGSSRRAVRAIKAHARAAGGGEQHLAADGEQTARDGQAALEQRFAAGRAVRDEQAVADAALVSVEIELAVEEGVVAERRARGVAGDGDRSGGRAVRGPQLHALSAAIGGGEDQPGAERDEVGGA